MDASARGASAGGASARDASARGASTSARGASARGASTGADMVRDGLGGGSGLVGGRVRAVSAIAAGALTGGTTTRRGGTWSADGAPPATPARRASRVGVTGNVVAGRAPRFTDGTSVVFRGVVTWRPRPASPRASGAASGDRVESPCTGGRAVATGTRAGDALVTRAPLGASGGTVGVKPPAKYPRAAPPIATMAYTLKVKTRGDAVGGGAGRGAPTLTGTLSGSIAKPCDKGTSLGKLSSAVNSSACSSPPRVTSSAPADGHGLDPVGVTSLASDGKSVSLSSSSSSGRCRGRRGLMGLHQSSSRR